MSCYPLPPPRHGTPRPVKCLGCPTVSHVYPGDAPRRWRKGYCPGCQKGALARAQAALAARRVMR